MKRTSDMLSSHRKRAKEAGQAIDYGLDQLRVLVQEAFFRPCPYCSGAITEQNFSADHTTPISRGGSFCLWNLEITCKACNLAKGLLNAVEFAHLWAALREMDSKARQDVLIRLRLGGVRKAGR